MKPRDRKGLQDKDSVPAGLGDNDWDCVAQASWESFPASDAPSWIGHHVDGPAVGADRQRRVKAGGGVSVMSNQVVIEGDSFVVDVALLARLFDMTAPDIQRLMRDGTMTSVCEKGFDEHQGQYRLIFVHGGRRAHINIDATGHVLARSITSRV